MDDKAYAILFIKSLSFQLSGDPWQRPSKATWASFVQRGHRFNKSKNNILTVFLWVFPQNRLSWQKVQCVHIQYIYRLRPCLSSVIFIRGCHPCMRFTIHGWHPLMTLSSMDEVLPSMDGIVICQIFLMFYKVLGQFWLKLVIYVSKMWWMTIPSMDESFICGCHPWMTLPSVDAIHGWRPLMTDMDGAIIIAKRMQSCGL